MPNENPTEAEINSGLLSAFNDAQNDEDKVKLFEVIARRASLQHAEKIALKKEVADLTEQRKAQEQSDFDTFADSFRSLLKSCSSEAAEEETGLPNLGNIDDLTKHMNTWTSRLKNAIGHVQEMATGFDDSVDNSRKRRRLREERAASSTTPASTTTTTAKPKTNEDIINALIM